MSFERLRNATRNLNDALKLAGWSYPSLQGEEYLKDPERIAKIRMQDVLILRKAFETLFKALEEDEKDARTVDGRYREAVYKSLKEEGGDDEDGEMQEQG